MPAYHTRDFDGDRISTTYSSGSPLTRCTISAMEAWEKAGCVDKVSDLSLSCAIPIIYDDDDGDYQHDAFNPTTTTPIFSIDDDARGPNEKQPFVSQSRLISSNTTHLTASSASDPDEDSTSTSCSGFLPFERLRLHSRSEDDLELSSDSEEEHIFRYSPFLDAETAEMDHFDAAEDNEILQYAFAARLMVIDSVCPEKAPHIIITPAATTPYDEYIAWSNRPQPQWSERLYVPYTSLSTDSLPPIHSDEVQRPQITTPFTPQAKKVFNRRKFELQIERASVERLVMYRVVTAVQRHAIKLVAIIAASVAKRLHLTSVDFVDPQAPYKWTDPAAPLLRWFTHLPRTIVLESNDAFRAPHIVLSEAPTENPWISWMNSSPEQHPCWLTIPGRLAVFDVPDDNENVDVDDDNLSTSSSSDDEAFEVDTPCPGSPICLADEVELVNDMDLSSVDFDLDEDDEPATKPQAWGDDDDLPAFDEWYLDIALRTGVNV